MIYETSLSSQPSRLSSYRDVKALQNWLHVRNGEERLVGFPLQNCPKSLSRAILYIIRLISKRSALKKEDEG